MDLHAVIGEGACVQIKQDRFRFARFQSNLGKVFQLLFRTDLFAGGVLYVELDNLPACNITGVGDINRNLDRIIRLGRDRRDHVHSCILSIRRICGRAADRLTVYDQLCIGISEGGVA